MSLFFADLVREFSSSTGAGDFVLAGAVPGHRRFAATVPAGAPFHYTIAGVTRPEEWETGTGVIGSGGALVRVPAASSAGGGLVSFSAGLKAVSLTVAAEWFDAQEAALAGKASLAGAAFAGALSAPTATLGALDVSGDVALTQNGKYIYGTVASGASTRLFGLSSVDVLYIGGIDAAIDSIAFFIGGAIRMGIGAGGISLPGTVSVAGSQVVGARRTGWSAAAGPASRESFATSSVTVEQLAERVKALIDDLSAHGLIGA